MNAIGRAVEAGDVDRMNELWALWKRYTPQKRKEIREQAPPELLPQLDDFEKRRPGSGGHNKPTGKAKVVIAVRVAQLTKMKADALTRKGVNLADLVTEAIEKKFDKL